MVEGGGRGHPALRGAEQQALLDEERLVHVLDGVLWLADADGQGLEAHRPTVEPPAHDREDLPGGLVQAQRVHTEEGQAVACHRSVHHAAALHLGEVPDLPEQAVADAGRAPGPSGDLGGPVLVQVDLEDPGGARDDGLQVGRLVVVQPGRQPEPVAQGPCDETGPRGRAHQREWWELEADRPGGRPLAQDDVEGEVLHRRVEHLLDCPGQSVDLVDEQHVTGLQLGQDGGQVAGALERRARGDVHLGSHLGGHDVGQGGLAEPRWSGEQEVVGSLPPPPGRLQHHPQVTLQLRLADELVEAAWSQPDLDRHLVDVGIQVCRQELLAHGRSPYALASRWSASRNRTAGSSPPRSTSTPRTSSLV